MVVFAKITTQMHLHRITYLLAALAACACVSVPKARASDSAPVRNVTAQVPYTFAGTHSLETYHGPAYLVHPSGLLTLRRASLQMVEHSPAITLVAGCATLDDTIITGVGPLVRAYAHGNRLEVCQSRLQVADGQAVYAPGTLSLDCTASQIVGGMEGDIQLSLDTVSSWDVSARSRIAVLSADRSEVHVRPDLAPLVITRAVIGHVRLVLVGRPAKGSPDLMLVQAPTGTALDAFTLTEATDAYELRPDASGAIYLRTKS